MKMYEVGGCVRDGILGTPSKDVDFVVEAESFAAMSAGISALGLRIFMEKPEFLTIRAGVPVGHSLRERCTDADFVLARRDGPTADGRRPESVEAGTLLDDLRRRDFTMNAIARALDGSLIDPHGGAADIDRRILRFVGDPVERIREDGLRVLRGLRFIVTKGLTGDPATMDAITGAVAAEMLSCVSEERIAIEVDKMMAHDTLRSLDVLARCPGPLLAAIFRGRIRLAATLKTPRR